MPEDDARPPDPSSLPMGGWPGLDYEVPEVEDDESDEAFVVWSATSRGQQPYIWRMKLHVHGQTCARA